LSKTVIKEKYFDKYKKMYAIIRVAFAVCFSIDLFRQTSCVFLDLDTTKRLDLTPNVSDK